MGIQEADTPANWANFVDRVNRNIDAFDLEFRAVLDEASSVKLYSIVSSSSALSSSENNRCSVRSTRGTTRSPSSRPTTPRPKLPSSKPW